MKLSKLFFQIFLFCFLEPEDAFLEVSTVIDANNVISGSENEGYFEEYTVEDELEATASDAKGFSLLNNHFDASRNRSKQLVDN